MGHLGDIGHHLADIFSVLGCRVVGLLDDRRFDGESVRKWTAGCSYSIVNTMLLVSFHFFRKVRF